MPLVLTDAWWSALVNTNDEVNKDVRYSDDPTHVKWGFADDGEGVCVDYALAKYKALLALGLSPDDMRVMLCAVIVNGMVDLTFVPGVDAQITPEKAREGTASNHAVLGIVTDRGRFIMDSRKNGAPLLWDDAFYRDSYIWIEELNAGTWVDIRGNNAAA